MDRCRYYDTKNDRLVELQKVSGKAFWNLLWGSQDLHSFVEDGKNNWFIRACARRYIKPGGKVIDAGCGAGNIVFGLSSWGFDAYGVDFEENTIERSKKAFPGLKLSIQDVRALNFPDSFFDGYWSLGVIEHFQEGFDGIIAEAARVLKPGGCLFLSFPNLNPLRRLKKTCGLYSFEENKKDDQAFYQFILCADFVVNKVMPFGFKLLSKKAFDPSKGLMEEISLLHPFLSNVYKSKRLWARLIRMMNYYLFSAFAGHSILLVFKKD